MPYPPNFLRGITSKEQLTEDGLLQTEVFMFSEKHVKQETDELAQSINWEDDGAMAFTLAQEDDDQIKFRAGVAVVPRQTLDDISGWPVIGGRLRYERQQLPGNPYHGNLLLAPGLPQLLKRYLAGAIALAATVVPRPADGD